MEVADPCFAGARATRPFHTVLQVIYLFADIATGDQPDDHQYPEPAKSTAGILGIFSLQVFNFAPPECVNRGATFYDKLLVKTLGPFFVPPLIYAYVRNDQTPRDQEMGLGDIELRETGLDFDESHVYPARPSTFGGGLLAARRLTLGTDE